MSSMASKLVARLARVYLDEYLDTRNKENLNRWLVKKFLIDQGIMPLPPDPRAPSTTTG